MGLGKGILRGFWVSLAAKKDLDLRNTPRKCELTWIVRFLLWAPGKISLAGKLGLDHTSLCVLGRWYSWS